MLLTTCSLVSELVPSPCSEQDSGLAVTETKVNKKHLDTCVKYVCTQVCKEDMNVFLTNCVQKLQQL